VPQCQWVWSYQLQLRIQLLLPDLHQLPAGRLPLEQVEQEVVLVVLGVVLVVLGVLVEVLVLV
jgi:hypothetical protein